MSEAPVALTARPRLWAARARHTVTLLAIATLLAGCEGGSGQSGSAFVFLSVDGFSLTAGGTTATVNSSIDTATSTTACVTLRNNLKNPTVTVGTALDNVVVQSYTVTLTAVSGGALPGPFTFGTAVLVPAGTIATGATNISNNTATFPVVLVPGRAKLEPSVRPPTPLPMVATAEITFKGRDGRGNSVQAEGAVTVVFVTGQADSEVNCVGTTSGSGNGTGTGTTTTN